MRPILMQIPIPIYLPALFHLEHSSLNSMCSPLPPPVSSYSPISSQTAMFGELPLEVNRSIGTYLGVTKVGRARRMAKLARLNKRSNEIWRGEYQMADIAFYNFWQRRPTVGWDLPWDTLCLYQRGLPDRELVKLLSMIVEVQTPRPSDFKLSSLLCLLKCGKPHFLAWLMSYLDLTRQEQGQEAWPVDLNDFMREERMDDLVLLYRSFNHLFGDRLVHEDMIYEVTHPTLNIVRFLHSHQSESFFRKLLMYYLGNVGDANPDVSFIQAVAAMKIDLFPLWIRCSFDMMSVIVELQPHIVHRKSTDRGLTALDQVLENSLEGILSSEDLCREVSQLLEWKSIPRTTILERLRIDLHRLKKKHRYRRFASKEHRDIAMELLKNLVPFFGTKQDCENIKSVIKTIGGIHEMKSNISRLGRSPRCHSMRTALEELGRRVAMAAWIVEPSAAMWRAVSSLLTLRMRADSS